MSLLTRVQRRLAARKGEWQQIADELDYSYEFISRLGLGTYKSSPTVGRLERIDSHLKTRPRRQVAA